MAKQGIGIVDNLRAQKLLKGVLCYKVFQTVNGAKRLIEEVEISNLIVDLARVQMAHLVAGETQDRHIAKIGFGTSNAKPVVGDAELAGTFMKGLDGFEYPQDGRVQFNWSLGNGDANGLAISEFGLFCEDGALFARRIREDPVTGEPLPPINKAADISLEGTWTIIF